MSVNEEVCWYKKDILATEGTKQCGGHFKEQTFRVTGCYVTLRSILDETPPLTVRVWTNLDQAADDESFAIDNVVVTKIEEGSAERCMISKNSVRIFVISAKILWEHTAILDKYELMLRHDLR